MRNESDDFFLFFLIAKLLDLLTENNIGNKKAVMEAVDGQPMTVILDLGQKSRSPLMTGFNAFEEMTLPCL